MFPTPIAERVEQAVHDQRERRLRPRYPIALQVQYKVVERGRLLFQGSGRTLNISSGGILLEICAGGPLFARGSIEVSVDWPFLLDGSLPLKLVATGHIVRNHSGTMAVEFAHYEMRTAPASRIR